MANNRITGVIPFVQLSFVICRLVINLFLAFFDADISVIAVWRLARFLSNDSKLSKLTVMHG